MTRQYLSTCQVPRPVSKEGLTGEFAHINLPFVGLLFFSGAQYAFPGGYALQNKKTLITGSTLPNTYKKDGGVIEVV